MANTPKLVLVLLQLLAAAILLLSLYLTFKGERGFAEIYATLGIEPWARFTACFLMVVCVLLLLIPATGRIGAILTVAVMIAIFAIHFFTIGSLVLDTHRDLFYLTAALLACCSANLYMRNLIAARES